MIVQMILLLILLILVMPIVLSIIAVVKVSGLRREFNALKRSLADVPRAEAQPEKASPPVAAPTPSPEAVPVSKPTEPPPPRPPVVPPSPPVTPIAPASNTEIALGGKVASFVGIGLLLIGIAFLVAYAIRHAWLGPEARIILGMLFGGGLVLTGHLAETRGRGRLRVLARTLTGGGSAIFYFCVFAAYGLYDLIGMQTAAAGLVACALAAFGLAMAYRSQSVAVIGVLGAFLMPVLIGEDTDDRTFLLVYMAVINLPVIALGIRRNWQVLYNTAFVLTALYVLVLLIDFRRESGAVLFVFSLVYFFEFSALGLLKLRGERRATGRNVDIIRLLLNSLMALGALYLILGEMDLEAWRGAAMIAMALVHIGLVQIGWKWLPSFTHDMLALLVGALTFVTLALPVQLDGVWISLGWAIEGAILCWFGLRARIPLLKSMAFMLGTLGLMKALLYDVQLYETAPALFWNARFVVGILCAFLLGVQGRLHARMARPDEPGTESPWTWITVLSAPALLVLFSTDIFWNLGFRHPWAWLLTSVALIVVAAGCILPARSQSLFAFTALALLLLVPMKLVIDMAVLAGIGIRPDRALFANDLFAGMAVMTLFMIWMSSALFRFEPFHTRWQTRTPAILLNLGALLTGILLVTTEWYRWDSNWNQTMVTVWWAACAIALVLEGLIRRNPSHRYAGLGLFALTTAKVLLVDFAELDGLERIVAFMSTGILLLILSFVYQRASARLLEGETS